MINLCSDRLYIDEGLTCTTYKTDEPEWKVEFKVTPFIQQMIEDIRKREGGFENKQLALEYHEETLSFHLVVYEINEPS